jgi:hypothetical protein
MVFAVLVNCTNINHPNLLYLQMLGTHYFGFRIGANRLTPLWLSIKHGCNPIIMRLWPVTLGVLGGEGIVGALLLKDVVLLLQLLLLLGGKGLDALDLVRLLLVSILYLV